LNFLEDTAHHLSLLLLYAFRQQSSSSYWYSYAASGILHCCGQKAGWMKTVWPGPRPTCVPSFVLIRPTIWPQCTNVTDRTGQTDRQRTDSIGRTVLQMVAQKPYKIGW